MSQQRWEEEGIEAASQQAQLRAELAKLSDAEVAELVSNRPGVTVPSVPLETIIRARIRAAERPEEAQQWLAVLREEARLREQQAEILPRRRMELVRYVTNWSGGVGAVGLGTWLAVHGFDLQGFFVMGAGLSVLAPEYVKNFVNRYFQERSSGKRGSDE